MKRQPQARRAALDSVADHPLHVAVVAHILDLEADATELGHHLVQEPVGLAFLCARRSHEYTVVDVHVRCQLLVPKHHRCASGHLFVQDHCCQPAILCGTGAPS